MALPSVVTLSDPEACDASLSGAKAANLARAAAANFPTVSGFVITTSGLAVGIDDPHVAQEVRRAFDRLCAGTDVMLVVRSSSVIEDAGESSMAGRFTSVLGVVGWDPFLAAVDSVIRSGETVLDEQGEVGAMAVLVQRQSSARFGGVMFGVDPVSGNRGHVVVEVVASGPDSLVGGTALADHYVLTRHGRIEQVTHTGDPPPLDRARRRDLAHMAQRAERVFGGPQDIEWLVDTEGRLWMLQSRPVTAIAAAHDDDRHSALFGPGPLAETFPAPLRPLEEDLWIPPLRDGISRALHTTGAVSHRVLERSPVVTTVGGWVAVDLELIGVVEARTSFRQRINPAAILRRLATAWRVGRLRVAMPRLAEAAVAAVDRDLATIPRLDALDTDDLVDLLDRAGRELATVHTYEVLAGMLMTTAPGGLSGAALALRALHDGRAAGWSDEQIVKGSPVVLSLTVPSLGAVPRLPPTAPTPSTSPVSTIDHLDQRESLRVRARWLQELLARAADELGYRLVTAGALTDAGSIGRLRLSELAAMAAGGPPPSDLTERVTRQPGPPLPVSFRLTTHGDVRPASVSTHARRARSGEGMPAGGGRVVGLVHQRPDEGVIPEGVILVTRHLEPQLAPILGELAGLVSETGSALSHLAILAREAQLPTVVGVPDALRRFPPGTKLMIDGSTGEIEVIETASNPQDDRRAVTP